VADRHSLLPEACRYVSHTAPAVAGGLLSINAVAFTEPINSRVAADSEAISAPCDSFYDIRRLVGREVYPPGSRSAFTLDPIMIDSALLHPSDQALSDSFCS